MGTKEEVKPNFKFLLICFSLRDSTKSFDNVTIIGCVNKRLGSADLGVADFEPLTYGPYM
jgi:hypothetical protein